MNPVFIYSFIFILFLSFVIRTIRNIFYQIFLWQLKEYRIDRLTSHLKTDQGRKLIFGPSTSLKWIFLLVIVAGILFEYNILFGTISLGFLSFLANIGFGLIWILEAAMSVKEFIAKKWRIPKFTIKVVLILMLILILQFSPLLFSGSIIQQLMIGPFLDKLLAPSIAFLIIAINVPSFIIKKIILLFAKRKIAQFHKLTVIGITGSYGKTSTKEFLATILSDKFNVAKTPEFTNTDIGIARYILKELKAINDIFVVEIGAYRKGEVRDICNIVNPKIGIITGINEQHLELFGSIDKTMEAKFELITSLGDSGIAVFNIANSYVRQMEDRCKKERPDLIRWEYQRIAKSSTENHPKNGNKVFAYDVKSNIDYVSFTLKHGDKKAICKVNLAGIQNVDNLLAASCIALELGLSLEEIKKVFAKIISPKKTMRLIKYINDVVLIDDTFNANPDGVMAALEYMRAFSGRKILVLTPLIELGNRSISIHQKIARMATETCNEIFLTNKNFSQVFINKTHIVNKDTSNNLIQKCYGKTLILFEGKEAGKILNRLLSAN